MRPKKNTLSSAVAGLEKALDSDRRSPDYAARLEEALAGVERAVRSQEAHLGGVDGGVIETDRGQARSQTVDRRLTGLHDELLALRAEAGELRDRLRDPDADVAPLRRRVASLKAALEAYEREEDEFVQEAVTTDIGAGD